MKSLVERLRDRLITVPKPGSEPFKPSPLFYWNVTIGGEHKAGDSAGYQSIFYGIAGYGDGGGYLQEHIYVVDPLCEEAAKAIEQLETDVDTLNVDVAMAWEKIG